MANTKDYLDQEAYEEQKENVKNLIKNVGFDYTVDQLKALANAADCVIEISESGINVTPGPYADGVGYGLSGVATAKSSISFLKNITKYMELEEQYKGKLDDPKVQYPQLPDRTVCCRWCQHRDLCIRLKQDSKQHSGSRAGDDHIYLWCGGTVFRCSHYPVQIDLPRATRQGTR